MTAAPLFVLLITLFSGPGLQTAPVAAPVDIPAAIRNLGSFDFDVRTSAARMLRRSPAAATVLLLEQTARSSPDDYARFRALVLLSGLDSAATSRVAAGLIGDRDDRIRTVVYQWFEHQPQLDVLPRLIEALPRELSEFVRPALTRAIAAYHADPRAQAALRPLVLKGEDLFRGSVITALGEYQGAYALEDIIAVAQLEGPLQDDAVTAIGRIGNNASRAAIAALQTSAPADLQPTVSAALCLLKIDCPARVAYITQTLKFATVTDGQQPLFRGAVHALSALARAGHQTAIDALLDAALAATGAARDELTLAIGGVVLRAPLVALGAFEARKQHRALGRLFQDAFDMLSEDFEEERFGSAVRGAFWAAPEGSPRRQAAQVLLDTLEF